MQSGHKNLDEKTCFADRECTGLIQHVTETQCYLIIWPKTMKNIGINLAQLPKSSDKDNVRSVNKLKWLFNKITTDSIRHTCTSKKQHVSRNKKY